MLVNGILILVFAAVVIQASRVNDEFFQEVRDLLERKDSQREDCDESNEVQAAEVIRRYYAYDKGKKLIDARLQAATST